MTFSDIDERQEETEDEEEQSDISWKSDEYAAMMGKSTSSKKHRVVFEDEIPSARSPVLRPKSACSVHQDKEGKVSRLYSLTKGQCGSAPRCNSALGLRWEYMSSPTWTRKTHLIRYFQIKILTFRCAPTFSAFPITWRINSKKIFQFFRVSVINPWDDSYLFK